MIEDTSIEVLLAKVKETRDKGLNDSQLDGVEEEIFNYVNENSLYVMLHGTVHFDRLVGYLVRSQKMNNLLVKTIAAGRYVLFACPLLMVKLFSFFSILFYFDI